MLAVSSDWSDNRPTTYSYYSNGDLAKEISPSGLTTTYTYDNLGRVLTKTEVSDTTRPVWSPHTPGTARATRLP
ncbi:RHS repeat protein [Streptacidiphilus sp. 4-A2]|nr:RHS repeat protein [Streptacidiphilus sp. 4-A2]